MGRDGAFLAGMEVPEGGKKTTTRAAGFVLAALLTVGLLAMAAGLLVSVKPAQAANPGNNGKIVYESDQNDGGPWDYDIWSMNPDGSAKKNLTEGNGWDVNPAISPDGTKIAFASSRDGNKEIFVMDQNGGSVKQLTFTGKLPDGSSISNNSPTWSPDGKKIAFVSNRPPDEFDQVWVINADGSGTPKQITHAANPSSNHINSAPDWSPKGTQIVFESFVPEPYPGCPTCGHSEIWVVNPDGIGERRLVTTSQTGCGISYQYPCGTGGRDPSWSPDGQKIAYIGDPFKTATSGGSLGNLIVVDATGANTRQVTKVDYYHQMYSPTWSPDGQQIALHRLNSVCCSEWDIYTVASSAVNAGEAQMKNLTTGQPGDGGNSSDNPSNYNPSWQPLNPPPPPDFLPPNAPVISSPANNSYDTDGIIAFSGTAEANSTVRLYEGNALKGTVRAGTNGAWSITVGTTTSRVINGKHSYTAKATDAAGNTSTASAARIITVDTIKPTVPVVAPLNGATGVGYSFDVKATFSEKMNPKTLTTATVKLVRSGTTTAVPAVVSYNATYKQVTLNPNAPLVAGAKYTATVTTGAKDVAGNPMAAAKVWSFTVKR